MSDDKISKPAADWELIEKLYRAGLLSLREISKSDNDTVTEGAIRKRAKKDGWTRNLKARIDQKADDLVRKAAVRKPSTQLTPVTEQQVIEAGAEQQTTVRLSQQGDIQRSRNLMLLLLTEVEITSENKELFDKLGELLDESGPDSNGTWRKDAMNELYKKVVSLTGRVDNSKKLVEMLEKLIKLERQAFGITDVETAASASDDALIRLGKTA